MYIERCANPRCPKRERRNDYLGHANAFMVDTPDMISLAYCSRRCLVEHQSVLLDQEETEQDSAVPIVATNKHKE